MTDIAVVLKTVYNLGISHQKVLTHHRTNSKAKIARLIKELKHETARSDRMRKEIVIANKRADQVMNKLVTNEAREGQETSE